MTNELAIAYSATVISISGRFIFMYLLYTKKSVNLYSLIFSIMNVGSSSLWIVYSQIRSDLPLLIRSSSDLVLFSISTAYILSNRLRINKIQPDTMSRYGPVSLPLHADSVSLAAPCPPS